MEWKLNLVVLLLSILTIQGSILIFLFGELLSAIREGFRARQTLK